MLVNETSAAAFLLTCFHGLARVSEKRAHMPSLAHVPGVAHPCSKPNKKCSCIHFQILLGVYKTLIQHPKYKISWLFTGLQRFFLHSITRHCNSYLHPHKTQDVEVFTQAFTQMSTPTLITKAPS